MLYQAFNLERKAKLDRRRFATNRLAASVDTDLLSIVLSA